MLRALSLAFLQILFCWGTASAGETPWTPNSLIEWVSKDHPRIKAAQLRRQGSESYLKGAGKQPNPQIKLSLSRGTVQEDANSLTQRFEIAGQPALRKNIASTLYDQADQETVLVARQVLLEALNGYYKVWMARRALEVSAVDHQLSIQLELTSWRRLTAGQASRDEYRQARLANLNSRAVLQRNAAAAQAAEANFRALIGLPEDQLLVLPDGPTPPVFAAATLPLREEIEAKIDLLPEVEIAEARARQAKFEAKLASKAGSPDLYIYAYRGDYSRVSNQGIQFGVSFPLFDWGELGAEHDRKKLLAESLQAEAEAARRTLKADLLQSLESCRGQRQYVELLERQFQERAVLAHHSLVAYELGLVSLLEALTSQRSYQSSLLELAQEAVSLESQRLNLHLTIKESL